MVEKSHVNRFFRRYKSFCYEQNEPSEYLCTPSGSFCPFRSFFSYPSSCPIPNHAKPKYTLHVILFRVDEGIDPYGFAKPYTVGQGIVSCRNARDFSVCLQFTVWDDAFHRPECETFRVDVGIDPYGFAKPHIGCAYKKSKALPCSFVCFIPVYIPHNIRMRRA